MPTRNAKMETAFYDNTPAYENEDCEVRIEDNGDIVVSYEDDDGYTLYQGKDNGNGHYILECQKLRAKATLHQIHGSSRFLEGSWIEEGARGFWKITLPKQ